MRVVIPYRLNNGIELRYAIRSLCMYTEVGDVIVIGEPPAWYKGRSIRYPNATYLFLKEENLIAKTSLIDGDFLYTNDDIFALRPFDNTIPNYYTDKPDHHHDYNYRKRYANFPEGWLNFDTHMPMVMNGEKFRQSISPGFTIKSMYANYHNLPGAYYEDLKFKGHHHYEHVMQRIEGRSFFSTHDNCLNDDMLKVLQELYPIPSQYE